MSKTNKEPAKCQSNPKKLETFWADRNDKNIKQFQRCKVCGCLTELGERCEYDK